MPNTYVNKVITGAGSTLIDLSQDTVTNASHIIGGRIGHLADGSSVSGTGSKTVTYSLSSGVSANVSPDSIITGEGLCLRLLAPSGYDLSNVSVTMGGVDITNSVFAFDTKEEPTLATKSITANGTYNATDDSADGYSSVTVNVPTGGGGLTFESGTYEPSANTSGEKILFANTHSAAPAFIMMVDATGTTNTTSNTNMQFVWYDYYKLYGVGMPWSASEYRYASAYYAYRATNTSALSVGGVHCAYNSDNADSGGINYPRFWTDELGFTPNSASTSRYWRAGRTYKWIAVWRQT